MIIIAAIFLIGLFCWMLFNLAVYALPFFVALTAGMFAYDTGAGAIGAIAVALLAGTVAFVFGQAAFACTRSSAVRSIIAMIYAAPAAYAGYHMVHGLAAIGAPAAAWHEFLSIAGSAIIGVVAWSRTGALARQDAAEMSARRIVSG
jgi:hypothetical protein